MLNIKKYGHSFLGLFKIDPKRFTKIIFILFLILNLIATSWLIRDRWDHASTNDGYVPPDDVNSVVYSVFKSSATVFCENSDLSGTQGSAFAIEIKPKINGDTSLITNFHVVKDCIGGKGKLSIIASNSKEYLARIVKFDKQNDLALIEIKASFKPLKFAQVFPEPGFWTMSLSSPLNLVGAVSIGNVIVHDGNEILSSVLISEGSSGGALVDNTGYVIGVTTWSASDGSRYTGAKSLGAFCAKIIKCKGDQYW